MNVTNYITIDNFFSINTNTQESKRLQNETPLSSFCPIAEITLAEMLEFFKRQPRESLICATATVKFDRNLNYYEQLNKIERCIHKYKNDKSNRKIKYLGFHETTKGNLPHVHFIIFNAYKAPWDKAFKSLGRHNTNKLSFQPVKNTAKYLEYITKEYSVSDKFYHNFI